jgi:hypothetical protein
MPMTDLQPRARELGRIRAGDQAVSAKGKSYPRKLDTWRLTSSQREYVEAAAAAYGGNVTEWKDGPTDGDQWQVIITAEHLDVLVPPPDVVNAISQWWEMWSGGGCLRRCTGEFAGAGGSELAQGGHCLCPADIATRLELSKKPKPEACKPTTRVTLILPRLPDLGVWVLVSHGTNAAVELPGSVDFLQRFSGQGVWVPGRLRLDQRTSKKGGQTHNFGVPVIEVPQVTFGELIAGSGQRVLGGAQAAVDAGLRALPTRSMDSTGEGTSEPQAADAGASPTTQGQRPAAARTSPNPSGSSGDGDGDRPFLRVNRARAKRLWPDSADVNDAVREARLDSITHEVTEGRLALFADVVEPADANAVLSELGRIADSAERAS